MQRGKNEASFLYESNTSCFYIHRVQTMTVKMALKIVFLALVQTDPITPN